MLFALWHISWQLRTTTVRMEHSKDAALGTETLLNSQVMNVLHSMQNTGKVTQLNRIVAHFLLIQ